MAASAKIGVPAFTIILLVPAMVLVAVAVTVYKLKQEMKLPPVSGPPS